MSDEGDVADDAAGDGGAVVTKAAARPQRPTGKRSRVRAVEAEDGEESTDVEAAEKGSAKKDASKSAKTSKAKSTQKDKAKKPKKAGSSSSINPFVFVYNYLKQVVAEMRKVIWPNRKQMLTYTSVVLVFLAFMVALVGGADLGLSKLVLLVFG
ncbi:MULTISPECIES: preprotein translocase subunit SecE [unclassified Mycobacterium]|uniref:preprotein translocase subunit SecE n=1 Tax=unclassified Mycobacterium TaxID=2642494 RepID=UPI002741335B|nr:MULTISPECIES: preprotein translocase subunit SecE [unclassified Mycobacterium]MDP7703927.1 preprotein translocase subunit SecE [Mycobacterium sp. TY815]MDP7722409.1 preprotein translocase subunit SecE [Mycobacterium sp. TY814]